MALINSKQAIAVHYESMRLPHLLAISTRGIRTTAISPPFIACVIQAALYYCKKCFVLLSEACLLFHRNEKKAKTVQICKAEEAGIADQYAWTVTGRR